MSERRGTEEPLQPFESARNGRPVPDDARCTLCSRGPREGELFGRGKADWDAPGMICPDCWEEMDS